MRRLLISLFIAASLPSCNKNIQQNVTIKPTESLADAMLRAKARDLDIGGVDLEEGTFTVLANKDQVSDLGDITKVSDIGLAPDSGYYTPAKLETKLKELTDAHLQNSVLVEIGRSLENRPIWAVKISNAPLAEDPGRPAILFNGMHHAREVMTVEVAVDIVEYLLTKYGTDPKVQEWVNRYQIWVVPMVNPDGSNKVWNGNSMWRKNARGNYGVDINRNYPYAWNTCSGSSGNQSAEDYRGPSAGSEPETQVLMKLVSQIRPVFDISFHSYSELVIYPYGCQGVRVPAPQRDLIEGIGKQLAEKIPSDSGNGYYSPGTAWQLLYSVDGGDIDWMYHEYQVIPFVVELNSDSLGFQPSYSRWRTPTVEKARAGWQFLLDRMGAAAISGTNFQPNTPLKIKDPQNRVYETTTNARGAFWVIVQPGAHEVTVGATKMVVEVGAKSVSLDGEKLWLRKVSNF